MIAGCKGGTRAVTGAHPNSRRERTDGMNGRVEKLLVHGYFGLGQPKRRRFPAALGSIGAADRGQGSGHGR
jgi:hypothetical protein